MSLGFIGLKTTDSSRRQSNQGHVWKRVAEIKVQSSLLTSEQLLDFVPKFASTLSAAEGHVI